VKTHMCSQTAFTLTAQTPQSKQQYFEMRFRPAALRS